VFDYLCLSVYLWFQLPLSKESTKLMNIQSEAQALFEYTREMRRDFHRHPELGFQEFRTAGIVARELNELGLEVSTGVGQTGVVALLEGANPGPTLLMRFDMDALPVTEETSAEYASLTPGLMHACGHDGHTAIGLSVARLLQSRREELAGTVKFVFQPAEEGLGGAEAMIASGVLENPRPVLTLALHLWNELPVGTFGISPGPVMAASEAFQVRIQGRGGHGAAPHQTVDPVPAAAQVITALQSIVSREIPPLESAVLSVTSVQAGTTFNVIPEFVELKGTIRTFQPEVRERVLDRFHQVVVGVSQAMGCQAEVEMKETTPAVVNDPQVAQRLQTVAERSFPAHTVESQYRTMISEDMAYMMQDIPGCYFFVGTANPGKAPVFAHHHPRFDVDEDALPGAVALLSSAAFEFLRS
jgi:amidohydrolase